MLHAVSSLLCAPWLLCTSLCVLRIVNEKLSYSISFLHFHCITLPIILYYPYLVTSQSALFVSNTRHRWEGTRLHHRGDEYEQMKLQLQKRMMSILLAHYPHLEDKVCYVNVGTPLDTQYYLNKMKGESYGLQVNGCVLRQKQLNCACAAAESRQGQG